MRSWRASLPSAVAIAIVAIAALSPAARAQELPSLEDLLARFRAVPGMELRFREEKQIALMRMPARSEGTIHYARPGRIARRVTSPRAQVVLIAGDELRMREGERVERIDLAAQPVLRSFVDTFAQLLRGDRAALEATYRLEYGPGDEGRWRLTLTPRSAPLERFLREMRFEGVGTTLHHMVATEVSGDVTTTTFTSADAARRYTDAEAARIFALD
jgi:outer membrane lipoprotein-sorting protein